MRHAGRLDPIAPRETRRQFRVGLLQMPRDQFADGAGERAGLPLDIDDPQCAGPFRLARWARGDRIELVANDRYWNGKPALARVVLRFIPEQAARTTAFGNARFPDAV